MTPFAHVSDLHLGHGPAAERAAALIVDTMLNEPGPLLLTGDITDGGRHEELDRFCELFRPLLRAGRVLTVPGNHDRLGHDLRDFFMHGPRVQVEQRGSLHIVRLDSTGPHNRRWIDGHGLLTRRDIEDVEAALRSAPPGTQSVLMMHHHPLPLPHDNIGERLVTAIGWPGARELQLGRELLSRIRGLCDLVLHGHRHAAVEMCPWPGDERPLRIFGAGSSTHQRRFRRFVSARAAACWMPVEPPPRLWAEPVPA
ncbi:MAG TPA: metallophosphoesterase [Myxococcales bacterium]|nr:metallophosphoesterase [Myxococcales bacterium]